MKILVIGNGGREHAICRALASATPQPQIFLAPGNGGSHDVATSVDIASHDIPALVAWAQQNQVDLVIPGPEAPLVAGIADAFTAAQIPCAAPNQAAAQLEGSKCFTRELCAEAGVPGPDFASVRDAAELAHALASFTDTPVVKADGLASGKGVFLPDNHAAAAHEAQRLLDGALGEAGHTVLLEERLSGVEASLFYACDGHSAVLLPHAQDHKRLYNSNLGPNTGGMGAISPNPDLTQPQVDTITRTIIEPLLDAMRQRSTPFTGFLFAGLMLTEQGPKLLEINVRLGDPETQAILPRLEDGVFLQLCQAIAQRKLHELPPLTFHTDATCAIVLAAAGYPDAPKRGDEIQISAELNTPQRWLLHAGTKQDQGAVCTHGGRIASIVAQSKEAHAARTLAYAGLRFVSFKGMQFRTDIGAAASTTPTSTPNQAA